MGALLVKHRLHRLPQTLHALQGRAVYLAVETRRPETLYGETNCWVYPDDAFGAYQLPNGEIIICLPDLARSPYWLHRRMSSSASFCVPPPPAPPSSPTPSQTKAGLLRLLA